MICSGPRRAGPGRFLGLTLISALESYVLPHTASRVLPLRCASRVCIESVYWLVNTEQQYKMYKTIIAHSQNFSISTLPQLSFMAM